jgi:ATP-dependent DNA helicase RecG
MTKGKIDPTNFSPFPKNPTIAKFFIQLGRVEELGSGVLNVSHYVKEYSGEKASFIEGDIFGTIIPITKTSAADKTENVDNAINGAINDATSGIINDVVNNAINDAVAKEVIDNLSDEEIETMRIIHTTNGGVRSKDIISQKLI